MPKPNKTLKVGGIANAGIDSDTDQLIITPKGGLVAVTVTDLRGNVVWIRHPLSGWYIEVDTRKEQTESEQEQCF